MSAREALLDQARSVLRRGGHPAYAPDDVACCGHAMDAHDDDGCTVGWEPADTRRPADGCPCRVKGWAS